MANILVNGYRATTGGGKMILDNYIKNLSYTSPEHNYIIITPNKKEYNFYQTKNISFLNTPLWFKKNILFPILYFLYYPIIIKKFKIDLVFNFGDVIIPTKTHQIYFFDWPYAVYKDKMIWNEMFFLEKFSRKIKAELIKVYISKVSLVLAQTEEMKSRLKSFFNINKIVVIPTPVGVSPIGCENAILQHKNTINLLYPASFYPHKNHNILLSVAEILKQRKLKYRIYITIDNSNFIKTINKRKLDDYLVNLGLLNKTQINCAYQNCDAILMPTLLETYGLPYYEAMAYKKPIITSNLGFAKDACGDSAVYFDPRDENSIISMIEFTFSNKKKLNERINKGVERYNLLPDWTSVINMYTECINKVLNNVKL